MSAGVDALTVERLEIADLFAALRGLLDEARWDYADTGSPTT